MVSHPIRLRGHVLDSDGRIVFSSHAFPDNVVLKACGSRSELRCPSCATLYRGDARHLVRAGLEGGKGIDESIATHPAVFLTLTAPGFGAVHRESSANACHSRDSRSLCPHGRSLACAAKHARNDEMIGTPLCHRCYDYAGAVLHNAHSAELWRRTTIYVARQLAASVGLSRTECAKALRLEHAKVAEFQRRGLVHFHAVVRADGRDGSPPPVDADPWRRLVSPRCGPWRSLTLDGGPKSTSGCSTETSLLAVSRATWRSTPPRSRPCTRDSSIGSAPNPTSRGAISRHTSSTWLPPHGSWAELPSCGTLGLRRHAHHLGYSGHFLTKSRGYSTTFGALREARAMWHQQKNPGDRGAETTTRRLRAVGRGWANGGESLFAAAQARQRAEDKKEADFVWHTRCE